MSASLFKACASTACLAVLFAAFACFGSAQAGGGAAGVGKAAVKPRGVSAVVREDFESPRRKGLGHALLKASEHLERVEGAGVGGSAGLKVSFERGSRRIAIRYPLGKALEEATLVFDVRFDENFQFVRGGKLLGLAPAKPVTGGQQSQPDRWSARIGFRPDGGLGNYIYHQDRPGQWGTGSRTQGFTFEKGRWYSLSFYVRVNKKADEPTALARIYVDGRLLVEDSGLRLRGEEGKGSLINSLLFSTFHGGHNPIDAPRDADGAFTTVNAYMDNIAVYSGLKIRSSPGACWQ